MEALHGESWCAKGSDAMPRLVHAPHTIAIGLRIPEGKPPKATGATHQPVRSIDEHETGHTRRQQYLHVV